MAVKPSRILIIIVILIVAGILVVHSFRSRLSIRQAEERRRFISTYVDLSLARARFADEPDSLRQGLTEVFQKNGVDSAWMGDYIKGLSGNIGKSEKIWREIGARLDSLRNRPPG